MPIYRTTGTLTGTIESENVAAAQAYLQQDEMAQYLDPPLEGVVESLQWHLHSDGHTYHIDAFALRELTDDELKQLSSEVSGQNSDGLGEGFEQQEFAETGGESEEDCDDCDGTGQYEREDEGLTLGETCDRCGGDGVLERENWGMISFDWQTNESIFVRVV